MAISGRIPNAAVSSQTFERAPLLNHCEIRYFNPALLSPEAFQLIPGGKVPASKPQRNLTLVSKILQVTLKHP